MLVCVDPQRFARVKEIFLSARLRSPSEWPAYLEVECRDDGELRREVEILLAAHSGATEAGKDATGDTRRFDGSARSGMSGSLPTGFLLDGKYIVEAEIGSGGMGSVYRARQLALRRYVAVKFISAGSHARPSVLRRFAREATTIARLKHPNIVTVYDSGEVPEVGAYIVMELLEGTSLAERIAACGRLPLSEAVTLMRQICSAVEAAHGAGVIHRDLKPHNVVLERPPAARGGPLCAKVLDFGVAKIASVSDAALTAPGALVGTPLYMSPEQCQGQELDARSDVYALGCVLYEMLTGQPPFPAGSVVAIVRKHLSERPAAPSTLVPGLGTMVDAVVAKALAKNAVDRFGSAGELARALAACESPSRDASRVPGEPLVQTTQPDAEPASPPGGAAVTAVDRDAETEVASATTGGLQHNLTRLVGRARQIRETESRLQESRLVTLIGPGGIGKTRLAQAVARSSRPRFPDGVVFVALARIADPALVASEVAKATGVKEVAGRTPTESLCLALSGRRMLLVLDNCEHVVEACAELARQLLRAGAGLSVLASSREVLGVAGEAVFTVSALELPPPGASADPDALARYAAVELFVDRARLARHDFALTASNALVVAELARRLEGIPLGIELAAARLRVLSLEQILAKMSDRLKLLVGGSRTGHERQRTLRATIQWSHELLGEVEQRVFAMLSVFSGGCTFDAAEAVCGRDDACGMLDAVTSLVDKSLLVQRDHPDAEPRFGMLEVVREYAAERLRETGAASEVEGRHAAYYLGLAERSEPELWSPRAAQCMARLEHEHANVRAALEWSLWHDPVRCLRAVAAIYPFWAIHGHLTEGRNWLRAALSTDEEPASAVRAKALRGAGWIARLKSDYAPAHLFYAESLRICREMGDIRLAAMASRGLGLVALDRADFREACIHLGEVLASGRALGNDDLVVYALLGLGEVARAEGDMVASRRFYEEALPLARREGDYKSLGAILGNIGMIACDEGDLSAAQAFFREALSIDRELGNRAGIATSIDGLAAVVAARGAWTCAARLLGVAEAVRGESEAGMEPVDRVFRDRHVAIVRERLGDSAFEGSTAEGRSMDVDRALLDVVDELERDGTGRDRGDLCFEP
jgi:non-specific serine/threonine protein kinase